MDLDWCPDDVKIIKCNSKFTVVDCSQMDLPQEVILIILKISLRKPKKICALDPQKQSWYPEDGGCLNVTPIVLGKWINNFSCLPSYPFNFS